MLILTRRINESIILNDDIRITVLSIMGCQVRFGCEAPKSVSIHREEIYRLIEREKRMALRGDDYE